MPNATRICTQVYNDPLGYNFMLLLWIVLSNGIFRKSVGCIRPTGAKGLRDSVVIRKVNAKLSFISYPYSYVFYLAFVSRKKTIIKGRLQNLYFRAVVLLA